MHTPLTSVSRSVLEALIRGHVREARSIRRSTHNRRFNAVTVQVLRRPAFVHLMQAKCLRHTLSTIPA